MRFGNKLGAALAVSLAHASGRRTPLSVSLHVTNRCNYSCAYCDVPGTPVPEMPLEDVCAVVDGFASLGCQRVGLTGGEPLVREDIGAIVRRCAGAGLFTGLVSNGALVKERLKELGPLDLLQLSLDGPSAVHDAARAPGAHDRVLEAARAARSAGLRVWLTAVLTRDSLATTGYVLDVARRLDAVAYFQPVVDYPICGSGARRLLPRAAAFRAAVEGLIEAKRAGEPVGNSEAGLRYLLDWPGPPKRPRRCWAGVLYADVYTDGRMYPCFNLVGGPAPDARAAGVRAAFAALEPPRCEGCWTYANIELDLLFSLEPGAVANALWLL